MKKKLKKPSIRTINHRDGGMSFYAEGGEFDFVRNQGQKPVLQDKNEEVIMGSNLSIPQINIQPNIVPTDVDTLDGFKRRLMKRYPGMQGVYGSEGQNLNIIKDPNYRAADYGYGNIEFIQPGNGTVNYSDDYQYVSPTPDKYTAVYNPQGANRGDVFLDMMHGMRDDEGYMKLLNAFTEKVKAARGDDMKYFYEQEAKNGYSDGQDQWERNYIDGQLRAQLAPGTLGMFSHGRKDYRQERKYDTPEMRQAAKDIRRYLKGKYEQGGELPMYATEGEVNPNFVGPVLPKKTTTYSYPYIAPSLAWQNSVKKFVAQEEARKKNPVPVKKYVPPVNKYVTATDNAKTNAVKQAEMNMLSYSDEEKKYFADNNIPTDKWYAEKKRLEDAAIVQRRKDIQQKAVNDLEKEDFTSARAENLGNAFRFFPEDPHSFIDDYINPFQMIGSMAGNLGSHFASDAGPFNLKRFLYDVAAPVAVGAMSSIGAKTTGQFLNNILNPIAGLESLVTRTPLKNAYKLNPFAAKNPSEVILHRVQKPGQTAEYLIGQHYASKPASSLNVGQKVKATQSNQPGFARGFSSDINDLSYYSNPNIMQARGYAGNPEILRMRVPTNQLPQYSIANYNKTRGIGDSYRSLKPSKEFILPIEMIQNAEKFGINDLAKLRSEYDAFNAANIPNWLRGYNGMPNQNNVFNPGLIGSKFFYDYLNSQNNSKKQFGGGIELSNRMFKEGGEYELTNEEIADLQSQGYDIELL